MTNAQRKHLVEIADDIGQRALELRVAALNRDIPRASLAVADIAQTFDGLDKFVEACKAEATT